MGDELTQKQEAFALAYVETGNAAEAYRRAYDVKAATQPKGCYVYALVHQDSGRILYVGKGTGNRMHHHLRDARNGRVSGLKKFLGLVAAIEDGEAIYPWCIEDGLSSATALRFERALICRIGFDNLLNSYGGQYSSDERAILRGEHLIGRLTRNLPNLDSVRKEIAILCIKELEEVVEMARMKVA